MSKNMCYIISFLFLLGLSNCTITKNITNTQEAKIKKITRTNLSAYHPIEVTEYDNKGNILIKEHYDKNNIFKQGTTYSYNKYGDLISTELYSNPQVKKQDNRTVVTKLQDIQSTYEYVYDEKDNIKSKHYKSPNGDYESRTDYFYEGTNLVKELVNINSNGEESTRKIINKYNNFNSIDTTRQYENEELYKLIVNKYDEYGIRLESVEKFKKGQQVDEIFTKKFDKQGNTVTFIYENQKGKYEKVINNYNGEGLVVQRKIFNKEGELNSSYSWKYKLDKFGNWISSEYSKNGILNSIKKREIEYYK